MRYEFHADAEHELYEAAAHYEEVVSGLGHRLLDDVERVVSLLLEHPELGARADEHLRHFVLARFPFSVVYSVAGDLVYIVAVAHGSREPYYWKARIQGR